MSKVITFVKHESVINKTAQERQEILDGLKLLDMITAAGELTDGIDEKWVELITGDSEDLVDEKLDAEINKIKADGYEKLCDALYDMVSFLNAKLGED